jgi:hypothetical protein
LIAIQSVGLYWANNRFIYMNDPESYHITFWVIGLGYALAAQSLVGLVAILLLAYARPISCGIPAAIDISIQLNPWQRRFHTAWKLIKSYPAVIPLRFLRPAPLLTFFNHIPDGTRFLAESDGDPRAGSQFRHFWQWTEELLPLRQVDLVNEIYTRVVEPDLADRYLTRFNAEHMTGPEMSELCQVLGASYVVAHTPQTVEVLLMAGYQTIAQVKLDSLKGFQEVLLAPSATLTLLRNASPVTVIEPAVPWMREGNLFTWQAKAGQSYIVRYRYNPGFRAYQYRSTLGVEPVSPMNGLSLTFMRVKSLEDGRVTLEFQPRWV